MKAYIISIVSAALICSIVKVLLPDKSAIGKIVGLLAGVLMTVTIISPLVKISFDRVENYFSSITMESQDYIADGELAAKENLRSVIKDRTEAYILDKATRLGLTVSVEVELDDSNHSIPCGATIQGSVSPYAREMMCKFMEDTLGIPKENQKWT